jgi:hypothetical protein
VSDEEAVGLMGGVSEDIITLFKSGLNSECLIGQFFVECLKHFHAIMASSRDGSRVDDEAKLSSSVLLECEKVLPLTSGEVVDGVTLLHITAALCEEVSSKLLSQCHLPSLLAVCGDIVRCHAQVLGRGDARDGVCLAVRETPSYEELLLGGSLSLNIVLGLLSAVMAGARTVSLPPLA